MGTYKKDGQKVCSYRTKGSGFKQREGLGIREEIYYCGGGEALEQVA